MNTLLPKFETANWKMEMMKRHRELHDLLFHFAPASLSMLRSLMVHNYFHIISILLHLVELSVQQHIPENPEKKHQLTFANLIN